MPLASGAPQGMTAAQKEVKYLTEGSTGELSNEVSLKYAVGEVLTHSHDAEASTDSASYVKLKTITLTKAFAMLRIKFDMKMESGGINAYGRVYKNGVAVGTEQGSASETYVTYSEDITGNWAIGDTIELWGWNDWSGAARLTYVKNFRVFGMLIYSSIGSNS